MAARDTDSALSYSEDSISALSPYGPPAELTELLLDVRTAGGMSGSPVFLAEDGVVIGIHHEGCEATTALAVPLTQDKIARWLAQHEAAKLEKSRLATEGT